MGIEGSAARSAKQHLRAVSEEPADSPHAVAMRRRKSARLRRKLAQLRSRSERIWGDASTKFRPDIAKARPPTSMGGGGEFNHIRPRLDQFRGLMSASTLSAGSQSRAIALLFLPSDVAQESHPCEVGRCNRARRSCLQRPPRYARRGWLSLDVLCFPLSDCPRVCMPECGGMVGAGLSTAAGARSISGASDGVTSTHRMLPFLHRSSCTCFSIARRVSHNLYSLRLGSSSGAQLVWRVLCPGSLACKLTPFETAIRLRLNL